MIIEITDKPISAGVVNQLIKEEYGAIVTFHGIVRGQSEDRKVLYMEYEAFEEMAEKKLTEIGREIISRWRLKDIAIIHRVGRLNVGDTAVIIAVAAPHRKEAFEACHYAIDRLKETVPIWKKEVFADGTRWVVENHSS